MTKRNETERCCMIVNPKSAGGKTGSKVPELRKAAEKWFADFEIMLTERAGHATELARQACKDGFDIVVAVGGDGTAHEVSNGLFDGDKPIKPDVVFSAIPAGTGSDLIKTLKMPRELDDAVATVAHGETLDSDAMHATFFVPSTGEQGTQICINVAGFGMNGEVVQRVNQSSKRFGGSIAFVTASVKAMTSYVPPTVTVAWTDQAGGEGSWTGEIFSVFLCNGAYCGGGMWVGRGGTMQDEALDMVIVPNLSLGRRLLGAPRLFTGTMEQVKGVERHLVRELRATTDATTPVLLDLDGEQPGALPVTLRVLPKTVRIRGRW